MRFKVECNHKGKPAADHAHYIRATIVDADCMVKKLVRQGYEVVLSNADTGFIISRH